MSSGFERLVAKRRKPPGGFQHWLNDRHAFPAPQQVNHDGIFTPAGTGPFRTSNPRTTRPTPGSQYRRKRPQLN
jgi:hypothetical protein